MRIKIIVRNVETGQLAEHEYNSDHPWSEQEARTWVFTHEWYPWSFHSFENI